MKYFLIIFFWKFALSYYYSIWEQTIFVDKNDYIILEQSDFDNFLSDQIVQSSGQLNITLQNSNDNAIFDAFLLEKSDLDCYLSSFSTSNEETTYCPFVNDPTKCQLKTNNFPLDFSNITQTKKYIVLDNTKFPEDKGAYHFTKLDLRLKIMIVVNASSAYYNAFIALVLVLAFIVLIGSIVIVIFFFKLRKAQKKIKKEKKDFSEDYLMNEKNIN